METFGKSALLGNRGAHNVDMLFLNETNPYLRKISSANSCGWPLGKDWCKEFIFVVVANVSANSSGGRQWLNMLCI